MFVVSYLLLSSVSLASFCIGADYVIFQCEDHWKRLPHGPVLRAVSDSAVHGVIGGWCWVNVLLGRQSGWRVTRAVQVLICVIMAAGMDLDHMIEARSLSIKDALNLSKRPFAHNTALVPLGAILLLIIMYLFPSLSQNTVTQDLPLMFTLSLLSHHLRDADRHGVWFAPFGSTPRIPFKCYVLLVVVMSIVVTMAPMGGRELWKWTASLVHKSRNYDMSTVTV